MDIATDPPAQQSRRPRASVFMIAWVANAPDAAPSRYVVRNLSEKGCRIADPKTLDKFDRLIVSIGQCAHVPAEVAWLRDGIAGLEFLEPIDLALARRPRLDGTVTLPQTGWLSEQRRPHQRVYG